MSQLIKYLSHSSLNETFQLIDSCDLSHSIGAIEYTDLSFSLCFFLVSEDASVDADARRLSILVEVVVLVEVNLFRLQGLHFERRYQLEASNGTDHLVNSS